MSSSLDTCISGLTVAMLDFFTTSYPGGHEMLKFVHFVVQCLKSNDN
jgi:hypothetical protein